MARSPLARAARIAAIVLAALAVLALLLDGVAAIVQPALDPDSEGVLRTTDEEGRVHETRLAVFEAEDGTLWIQSGHHFRGWYERLAHSARVELERNGKTAAYRAVPLETPEARAEVRRLIVQQVGVVGFWAIRTFLLFAEIKPVRLDPL